MIVQAGSRPRRRPTLGRTPGRRVPRSFGVGQGPFPDNILGIQVWMAFGADPTADPATWAWTDISAYVLYEQGVTISRGRRDEQTKTPPSTCSFRIRNDGGRFSPRNVSGPYYGAVGLNTPVRVVVNPGSGWHIRYTGFWTQPSPRRDVTANYRYIDVVAKGPLRRLAAATAPVKSALRRWYDAQTAPAPAGYWPLEDPRDASRSEVAVGPYAMLYYGQQAEPGSAAVPIGSASGVRVVGGRSGPASEGISHIQSRVILSAATELVVDYWLTAHTSQVASGVDGLRVWTVVSSYPISTENVIIQIQKGTSAEDFWIQVADTGGNDTITITSTAAATVLDGRPHNLRVVFVDNGADCDVEVFVDDTSVGTGTAIGVTVSDYSYVAPMELAVWLDAAAYISAAAVTVSHYAIWDDQTAPSSYDAGIGFVGEDAIVRFDRICDEEGVPVDVPVATASTPMGGQRPGAFLAVLEQCAEVAEMPIVERFAGHIGIDPPASRYNQTATLTLDWSANEIAAVPEPTDDDQQIRNNVQITRDGGGTVTSTDVSGVLGTSVVGTYDHAKTLIVPTDYHAGQHASMRRYMGTVDEQRWPAVTLHLTRDPDLIDSWLLMDIGKVYAISNPDETDTGPGTIEQILEGYTERIDQVQWTVTLNGSPASIWTVGVYEDASSTSDPDAPRRYGATDLRVATSFNAGTDTSLVVQDYTASVSDPVTEDAGDLPVYVRLAPAGRTSGGVVMEVTAVGAAVAGQQTLTVTQAPVNAVERIVPVGWAVTLYQPARYAL